MEGLTVLEEQIIYGPNPIGAYILCSSAIAIVIGFTLSFIFDIDCLIICIISLLSFVLGIFISVLPGGTPTDKAIYTVRIEEKIDLNEFLNNYEVVKHEKYSNIYKIKGKKMILEE